MMEGAGYVFVLFAIIWLVTFIPAWKLFLSLLALSASPKGLGGRFWFRLLAYRLLIIAPYIVLLVAGHEVIPDLVRNVIIGLLVTGALLSVVRFVFRDKIIAFLWWIYGFVYDGLLHYAPYRRLTTAVSDMAAEEQPAAKDILELGCGTGNVIAALKINFPDAHITGVDSSRSMVKVAHARHGSQMIMLEDILTFMRRQASGSYDLVIMQNVLYAVNDRDALWSELSRILKDKGKVVITNSDRDGSGSITKEHMRFGKWYELLHPKLLCVGVIDAFISQLSKSGSFHFISEEQIRTEVAGRFLMSKTDRVYGDVNILFTLEKRNHAG